MRVLFSQSTDRQTLAGETLDSGGAAGKARGSDAAQCLEGLQSSVPQKAAAAGGRILARALPFDPARDLAIYPPNLALQPQRMSAWARWKAVLRELLGHGRGASRQLSAILVCTLLYPWHHLCQKAAFSVRHSCSVCLLLSMCTDLAAGGELRESAAVCVVGGGVPAVSSAGPYGSSQWQDSGVCAQTGQGCICASHRPQRRSGASLDRCSCSEWSQCQLAIPSLLLCAMHVSDVVALCMQAVASAILAPSLRHVADSLALSWRRQLTDVAHRRYLKRINFYTVSNLAGMQVLPAHCSCGRLKPCACHTRRPQGNYWDLRRPATFGHCLWRQLASQPRLVRVTAMMATC
jgi:hypothetical protein